MVVYADDVNLLGDNINMMMENKESVFDVRMLIYNKHRLRKEHRLRVFENRLLRRIF
jgi:hypothetical protein